MTQRNLVELTCQMVVELLTEYLSQALPPAERARVEEHLRDCSPCSTYLQQLKASIALAGALKDGEPAGPNEALLNTLRASKK